MVVEASAFVKGKDKDSRRPLRAIHHGIDQLFGFGHAILNVRGGAVGFLVRVGLFDEGDRGEVAALRIR